MEHDNNIYNLERSMQAEHVSMIVINSGTDEIRRLKAQKSRDSDW